MMCVACGATCSSCVPGPSDRLLARRAWTIRLALVLVVASFGWFTWHYFEHMRGRLELSRESMCYEHGGFPAAGGCKPPVVQVEFKLSPPTPSGPVL